jgi:serine/threonine-protein kinase RsbW
LESILSLRFRRPRQQPSTRTSRSLTSPPPLCYPYPALDSPSNGGTGAATQRVEVTLETLLDSVALAEDICVRIASNLGFDDDDCHKIGMSVREGVINAYKYGNASERGKKIYLIIELEPEKLIIHVHDQGRGFDLQDVPDPLAEENLLKTSGRGIFLMRTFMDEFDVRRSTRGGAELVMAKRYPSHRDAPPSPPSALSKET